MLGQFIIVWILGFCFNAGAAVLIKNIVNDEKLVDREALIVYAAFGPILSVMIIAAMIYSIGKVVMHNVNK